MELATSSTLSFWTASSGLVVLPLLFWLWSRPRAIDSGLAASFSFFLAADEVFHIPQAQKYCQGRFREWDDKITTPPGLYLLSLLLPGVVRPNGSLGGYVCDVKSLRAANAVALMILAYLALQCRHEIEARLYEAHTSARPRRISQYALHTALNMALFPLLFFFSGLYYTDVASTAAVLAAYLNHLRRLGRDQSSFSSDLSTILVGIFTLLFRQTNVFWVVVYMGGLEAVHAIKTLQPERIEQPVTLTLIERVKHYTWRYSLGYIHDPPLGMMWPDDVIFCVISFGVAAMCNPIRVVRQIYPYVAVLVSFAAFVAWNGGVVLGDKSNHVATIHLPQMLYIWPFFAFFSLPLLLPYSLPVVNVLLRILPSAEAERPADNSVPETDATAAFPLFSDSRSQKSGQQVSSSISASDSAGDGLRNNNAQISHALKLASFIFGSKIVLWPICLLASILLSIAIVHYNTIIHPFTLADNRHYMFYIFRYTIRRASWIRYALVIPYTAARWMTWGTMAGCSQWFLAVDEPACSSCLDAPPFMSHPFITNDGLARQQAKEVSPEESKQELLNKALERDPLLASVVPASTSTGLIFLLATTLSLMTAPLVEPRYFIIPWAMWRLLAPAWRLHGHGNPSDFVARLSRHPKTMRWIQQFQHYDPRLIFETVWFLAINMATGYIFLCKPYLWKAEDGTLLDDGRLQRFMW
ncbi:hypothetical protein F66182_8756 [Fusarium sp. NRRL 66182]|nr:hypothetical protein F66182_8756 [Fusarium sp. NRRL 66182]